MLHRNACKERQRELRPSPNWTAPVILGLPTVHPGHSRSYRRITQIRRPDRQRRLLRQLERDDPGLGCRQSPLGILNDLTDVEVELGGKLLADSPNFLDNWIVEH